MTRAPRDPRHSPTAPALALLVAALLAGCGDGGGPAPASPPAPPVLVTQSVDYAHGDTQLEGYLAYDAAPAGKRPGILVIHEWWGLDEHPKERARRLAALGYVAFCPDMYGKGRRTDDPQQASAWANEFRSDRFGLGRARIRAGYDVLAANPLVDPARIGAIGFCYGGSVALELAWSGAKVQAVVSFHGQPLPPRPEDVAGVQGRVLVCHGAADDFVSRESLDEFESAMAEAGIAWHLVKYGGAVHSFTNPGADARGIGGVKYHAEADRLSWAHMRAFFEDAFAR